MSKGGRPTKYSPDFIAKVDEYLELRKDEQLQNKVKVRLPTRSGFAKFIGVSQQTLTNWEKENEEFFGALAKIDAEQQERLIDMGLSGDYNSTIAKLILSSNHGMAEKSEQKHTGNLSLTQVLNEVDGNE